MTTFLKVLLGTALLIYAVTILTLFTIAYSRVLTLGAIVIEGEIENELREVQ